jgi:hypothetical protein
MGGFYRFGEVSMVPMGNEPAELGETKSPAEAGLA